jgi:hypothetical protein
MKLDETFDEVVSAFKRRKFSAGLAISFIDMLRQLEVPASKISSTADFLAEYPRKEFRSPGHHVNTLMIDLKDGKTLTLRPFYNAIEAYFRAQQKRFDYPSCPGHATAAWQDYALWFDSMCGFSDAQLLQLRKKIVDFVLSSLPSQAFDPSKIKRDPPLFSLILDGFDLTKHKGELTGAAYQGLVFGFLRADNSHLQVEIDKVRTGSKRLQRVGDIDAWEGARLAITAEVKQYILTEKDVEQLSGFANEANRRNAIGIVCTLGFEEGIREQVEALGVRAIDNVDLQSIVQLWDPMKQRTAVASMLYYVKQIEKSSALGSRLDAFIEASSEAFEVAGSEEGA